MSKRNNFVFIGLHIVAWVIFVGLCIEAGGLIVNFVFSLYKPEFVQNLYQKLDLSEMYNTKQMGFFRYVQFYPGHLDFEGIPVLCCHHAFTQT